MSAFEAKNSQVRARQDKVQTLVIPLVITGAATSENVVCRNDEPALLFLQTAGIDQITGALAANETATYTTAAADATGVFRILVKIDEQVAKIQGACLLRRDAAAAPEPVFLGSATGITTGSAGGKSIMLAADSAVNLTSANLDACLVLHYVVAEGN